MKNIERLGLKMPSRQWHQCYLKSFPAGFVAHTKKETTFSSSTCTNKNGRR